MKISYLLVAMLVSTNVVLAQGPGAGQRFAPSLPVILPKGDTSHTITKHFTVSSKSAIPTDSDGFIKRWLVLEPVKKNIARNNIFTESYLRTAFSTDNFSTDFLKIPQNNTTVKVGEQELTWYALDSKSFNFNLYHFTYALNKPKFGILVWLVTVVNATEEIQNVRMAAGCNSGGMWWLNGEEAMILSGDRDMIIDNVTSQKLTLKKGKNIIRGVVINGPGMANFALRFIDKKGESIKNISISNE